MRTTCASPKPTSSLSAGTAAILTSGCRLNQSESDALRRKLLAQGIVIVPDPGAADVCYVNTCTVTARADRSSMQLIHRACRAPRPRVVVLGCLAERAPERLRAIPGIAEVWDNRRKQQEIAGTCPSPGRSRALLKVQDGCSRRCRFCIVSGLRGSPLSVPAEQVVEQFNSLVAEGFTEVVLSGLNLGTYHDRGMSLAGLVERLLGQPSACRIRLGSIEPDTVGPALVELISSPRLCPHLHLPLQSGDDALLRAMCRPYNTGAYRQLLDQLLRVRPEMNLGADVIVGFPSEDDASFARTMAFLTSSPLCYLHVFPFSPRPGVEVPGPRPATAATRARVQVLRDLSLGRNHAYARRFIGTVRPAVVETARTALTDNYLRVGLTCPLPARSAVHLRITSEGDRLLGCPI